jgi:hypothetical protein
MSQPTVLIFDLLQKFLESETLFQASAGSIAYDGRNRGDP